MANGFLPELLENTMSANGAVGFSFKNFAKSTFLLCRAGSVRAETVINCQGREKSETGCWGASLNITWAFVPPMPKELTPARRGVRSQCARSWITYNGPLSKCRFGFGC